MERHNSLLYHRIALVGKPKAYFLYSRRRLCFAALAGGVISVISQITVDDAANREQAIVNRLKKGNQNLPRDGIK
jgi:hypothetical protein